MLKEWARIGAILLAIPALVVFPIWTVLALLIIVYLVGEEGRALFRHSRRAGLIAAREFQREAHQEETIEVETVVSPPDWKSSEPVSNADSAYNGRSEKKIAPDMPGANDVLQNSGGDESLEPPLG